MRPRSRRFNSFIARALLRLKLAFAQDPHPFWASNDVAVCRMV